MITPSGFTPLPQLLKAVTKPDRVSTRELEMAQPVYIAGLPAAGETVSKQDFDALVARVAALETPTP